MKNTGIDGAVAALERADREDFNLRRVVLNSFTQDLLDHPALGAQLIAQLCAKPEPGEREEHLAELLGAGLDAARMAQENGKASGDRLLAALEEALALARRQGHLSGVHRLLLAQIWSRNGLIAPALLELQRDDVLPSEPQGRGSPAEGEAMLEELFAGLTKEARGEPIVLHKALTETFPAMPQDLREQVVAYSVGRNDPLHARLACYWLLDPDSSIRLAAACGLSDRFARNLVGGSALATLVVIRSWMPEDTARRHIDALLKEALRKGIRATPEASPWKITDVRASLPDGSGAQSIMLALQHGSKRKVTMLLLKQDHGVKDAYEFSCRTAADLKAFLAEATEDVGVLKVDLPYVRRALSHALADGLSKGKPPVPGLLDAAHLCGFEDLRPEPVSTADLIAEIPAAAKIAPLTPKARAQLLAASDDLWERLDFIDTWFEDSDAARQVLSDAPSPEAAEAALWAWLEGRREWWARIFARTAATCDAASNKDASAILICAMELVEGRPLRNIPLIGDVHALTIQAWNAEGTHEEVAFEELDIEGSLPEHDGEFAAYLNGSRRSVDWVEGYLTLVVILPELESPDLWMPQIMTDDVIVKDQAGFLRLIELVMQRAKIATELTADVDALIGSLTHRPTKALQEWFAGFCAGVTQFKSSWPKASLTQEDKRLLAFAKRRNLDPVDLVEFAGLIALRQVQNVGTASAL